MTNVSRDALLTVAHAAGMEGDDARTAVESFETRLRALSADEMLSLFGPDAARVAAALCRTGRVTA